MICTSCGRPIADKDKGCEHCFHHFEQWEYELAPDYAVCFKGEAIDIVFANITTGMLLFKQEGSFKGPYPFSDVESIQVFNGKTLIFDYPRMGMSIVKMDYGRNDYSIVFDLKTNALLYKSHNKKKVQNLVKMFRLLTSQ